MVGVCGVQTFRKWRDERRAEKQKALDEEDADRKRKGIMTGREIFMQARSSAGVARCPLHLLCPVASYVQSMGPLLPHNAV